MRVIDKWVSRFLPWLTLAMVLITFAIVVLRYAFELGWVWMQECVVYMHSFVFLLGSAWALGRDAHVRVDIFYQPSSPKRKAIVDLTGSLVLLIPACLVIFHQAYPYVLDSWSVFEGSKDGGGLEAVFILKTVILLFCLLLFLQAVSIIRKSLSILRN